MTVSKAQLKATAKYEKNNYLKVMVRFKKTYEDELREYAELSGESLNNFIVTAVQEKIDRMKNK